MNKKYTYQELAALGEKIVLTSSQALIIKEQLQSVSSSARRPILRDGHIVYTGDYTKDEYAQWVLMFRGLHVLGAQSKSAVQDGEKKSVLLHMRTFGARNASPVGTDYTQQTMNSDADGSYEQVAKLWNMPRTLPIASYAAIFYLLYARRERGDKRAAIELDYFIAKLEPWILSYLDMATGGEARYMSSMAKKYVKGTAPAEVEAEALASKFITFPNGLAQLHRVDGKSIDLSREGGRPAAWMAWKAIRDELGMDALNWCIIAHLESDSGSYGGPLWSNAAYLIRKRELGQISPVFLVDQAFSLQHNGGEIFNKMWSVKDLVHVLNDAFAGKTQRLPKYLTVPEHVALYRKVCVEATPYDLKQQEGELRLRVKEVASFERSTVLGLEALASV